jgi:putative aminopeptidase FrvX
MELATLLKEMTMIPALSGHEEKMARYLSKVLRPLVDEIAIDKAGNLITKINGSDPKAPKIMVFAHMDQLGFMVRQIENDGFIRLERLGGIPEKVLPGTGVWVEAEDETVYPGVIGNKAHHATPPEEKYVVTPYSKLYVDIGAKSNQELYDLGIDIGSPVVYQPHFENLLGSRIAATAIDDRGPKTSCRYFVFGWVGFGRIQSTGSVSGGGGYYTGFCNIIGFDDRRRHSRSERPFRCETGWGTHYGIV